ncbi:uncharacterized protein BCR38DRAFT_453435 [Pseudomassariella vexata]|uniref:Uncharacterized protein n=1 Tax=Pseudomassariella vexata TaxID=1141098 RepID=A0A1Y2D5J4_9PEZI|nr:uncharacterized protein BCR38DRAFT_453435 [Pseudomassariella vexata]ORY54553.1 hypothetical protein BCR38DRAFT_453435 [Pseudomassariella vexata]
MANSVNKLVQNTGSKYFRHWQCLPALATIVFVEEFVSICIHSSKRDQVLKRLVAQHVGA